MELYEILVPSKNDKGEIIPEWYHKDWDFKVSKVSGGLSVMKPVLGKWIFGVTLQSEEMIPVRIACELSEIREIAEMTAYHYNQKSVMYYLVSKGVEFYTR